MWNADVKRDILIDYLCRALGAAIAPPKLNNYDNNVGSNSNTNN